MGGGMVEEKEKEKRREKNEKWEMIVWFKIVKWKPRRRKWNEEKEEKTKAKNVWEIES